MSLLLFLKVMGGSRLAHREMAPQVEASATLERSVQKMLNMPNSTVAELIPQLDLFTCSIEHSEQLTP